MSFPDTLPYASSRQPVYARNCVATSQPLAAQAGLEMLRKGGNAFDAAVATAMCLTVVEPTSNGIGSDAFAIAWAGGGLHALNASGRSPALLTQNEINTRFAGMDRIPYYGWGGVTTPGAVSAWAALPRAVRRPAADRCSPSPRSATRATASSSPPQTATTGPSPPAATTPTAFPSLARRPSHRAASPPRPASLFRLPEAHARTLEAIADTKGEAFYRGRPRREDRWPRRARTAAWLREADLANHNTPRLGPPHLDRLPRAHPPRDPAQRPGHHRLIALGILRHVRSPGHAPTTPPACTCRSRR
jgi:gamma-glutamyltranspeptidase/glutathione hydrolase